MRTKEQARAAYTGMKPVEVAAMLDCSKAHVIALVKAGAMEAVDISVGQRPEYRISRESFDAFLEARRVPPDADPGVPEIEVGEDIGGLAERLAREE